jgi:hypothetical protein
VVVTPRTDLPPELEAGRELALRYLAGTKRTWREWFIAITKGETK